MDELEEWKQAASVEADLRREAFRERDEWIAYAEKLELALETVCNMNLVRPRKPTPTSISGIAKGAKASSAELPREAR